MSAITLINYLLQCCVDPDVKLRIKELIRRLGINASGLDLSFAIFNNMDLSFMNFKEAYLSNCQFHNCHLYDANFDKADICQSIFKDCYGCPNITNAQFTNSIIKEM